MFVGRIGTSCRPRVWDPWFRETLFWNIWNRSSASVEFHVENNNNTEWRLTGILPCKKYSLEIAPIFQETEGIWKEIKFTTFPDETFFKVNKTEKVFSFSDIFT